jgi:hypothetical protein
MPSHKVLKSVVHNVAESFTSTLNYSDTDYIPGHIVKAAWQTGATELRVNLLTGETSKSELLVKPVLASFNHYVSNFTDLVTRSRSSLEFVKSAEMIITIEPKTRRPHLDPWGHFDGKTYQSPATLTVNLIDDTGKLYTHTIKDWWFPET